MATRSAGKSRTPEQWLEFFQKRNRQVSRGQEEGSLVTFWSVESLSSYIKIFAESEKDYTTAEVLAELIISIKNK